MLLQQLDRLVIFLMGIIYAWIFRVIWREVIPDIKGWIQEIKKDSTEGTAESDKKITC